VYYLIVTVLGCVDLQTTTKQLLANRWHALRGRPAPYDPASWHPRDRAAARWYGVLIAVGYAFCLATMVFTLIPLVAHVFGTVAGRLTGNGRQDGAALADSVLFLALCLSELAVAGALYLRERRAVRTGSAGVAAPQTAPKSSARTSA